MCAAGAHDYVRIIDGITIPAPVVCSRCGEPAPKIFVDPGVGDVQVEGVFKGIPQKLAIGKYVSGNGRTGS